MKQVKNLFWIAADMAAIALAIVVSMAGCKNPLDDAGPTPVTIAAVQGVTAPVTGAAPVTVITATKQYTGTIIWSPADNSFKASTVYTATITLKAKEDYTLKGVAANFFTVEGATTTNAANSGVITAVFPSTAGTTAEPVKIDLAAISGVTAPVTGAAPVTTIETAQYTGTVIWSPAVSATFAASTTYTATITLTAKNGFTLTGVAADFFTVAGATATNAADSGVITAVFPATGESADNTITGGGGGSGGGGGNGNDYIPPEDKPVKDRWGKWIADDATATLDYSVAADGVCTITVGGTAQPNNETDSWGRWKAQAQYDYTAQAGKSYSYKFEAWTESGTRELGFQYNTDNVEEIYIGETVSITNTRTTYTVYGQPLSRNVINHVEFQCADQLGTFYVKMLEIKEFIFVPSSGTFASITDMAAWLNDQPANNAATAHTIKLNVSDLNGDGDTPGSVGYVLRESNKYVNLDLGSTITSIGDFAFSECSRLTSIIIPDSVTNIGDWAFYECRSLTSVTIPNSVTSIGDALFVNCNGLTAITVDSGNTNYSSDQGVLYDKSKTTLFQYPAGKTGNSFAIPNGVTSIGVGAFQNCTGGLASVTIPNSVTSIGWHAFAWCWNLTSITIPNSVTSIDGPAFAFCRSLTVINVDSGNTNYSSDQGILYDKSKTTLIQYPAGKTGSSFVIPNSVTNIGGAAFFGCTSLTGVTIPNSVTSIEDGAFYECENLTSVTFQGTISADCFSDVEAFPGDLRDKFYATDPDNGTPGTYTRENGSDTWEKQP